MRNFVMVAVLMFACSGEEDDDHLFDEALGPCEQMRDHLINLRLAQAPGVDRDAHREAMRSALGAEFVERCQSSMTATQINCVMYALDAEVAAACVSSAQ